MIEKRHVVFGLAAAVVIASSSLALSQPTSLGWQEAVVPGSKIGEFRHGTFPSLGNNTHLGHDLVAPCGTPVRAWKKGRIVDIVEKKSDPNHNTLGFMVMLDHSGYSSPSPEYSLYLHLKEQPKGANKKNLAKGMEVAQGDIIGLVGDTGAAQGCHLHFEVRRFAERFHPAWKNIYGPGDKRADTVFLRDWIDPGKPIAPKAPSYDAIYIDPRGIIKGVTRLPPRSVVLDDMPDCQKADLKAVSAIVPKGIKCLGYVVDEGVSYLIFPNWMRTRDEPGTMRVVVAGSRPQVLSDVSGSTGGMIVAVKVDGQYLEFLAVAPLARYSEKAGHPYLRYRVTGTAGVRRMQVMPGAPFAKGQSPIDQRRREVIASTQPQSAAANAAAGPSSSRPPARQAPALAIPVRQEVNNSSCGSVGRDGVIYNLGDFFACDEPAAIRALQSGRRILFVPGRVAFNQGQFLSTMNQDSAVVAQAKERLKEREQGSRPSQGYNNDFGIVVRSSPFSVTCRFGSRQISQGQQLVTFAKLVSFSSRSIVLDCS